MFWRLRKRIRETAAFTKAMRTAVAEHGSSVRAAVGRSTAAQIADIIALRRGPGRLAPDEYYQYRLFDTQRFNKEQRRAFLGRQLEYDLWELLGCWAWHAIANDKLVAQNYLESLNLPLPRLYGAYHPVRRLGHVPVLADAPSLGSFLRESIPYPFVAKPVLGMWGKNVYAVTALDRERDELTLSNGQRLTVEEFVSALEPGFGRGGYLFQERLKPHPEIAALCGERICSVRVVTILDPRPVVISTLWKVATGTAMADNFWEAGNLVAPVDADTGRVGQTFTGMGLQRVDISEHPDTGRTLVGATLPDWPRVLELCREGTASLTGLKMQAWDVALTDRGPVLLEVNIIGGLRLPQLVVDAGLHRGPLKELLGKHGFAS